MFFFVYDHLILQNIVFFTQEKDRDCVFSFDWCVGDVMQSGPCKYIASDAMYSGCIESA